MKYFRFQTLAEVEGVMKRSTLFTPGAVDYFFYTKNAVNWTQFLIL